MNAEKQTAARISADATAPVEKAPRAWPVNPRTLASAYAEGRRAWPSVTLGEERFAAHCARVLGEAPDYNWLRHATELYLCCACAAGDREATRILETNVLTPIGRALYRKHKDRELLQETVQILRTKLLVGQDAKIGTYAGRGALMAWLGVAAARVEVDVRRSQKSHGSVEPCLSEGAITVDADQTSNLIEKRYLPSFAQALEAAIQDVSPHDRALLHSCIQGSSIDKLGEVYSIHRATAARWIERARNRIFASLRQTLMREHALSDEEFDSIAREMCERLDVSLASMLEASPSSPQPPTVLARAARRAPRVDSNGQPRRNRSALPALALERGHGELGVGGHADGVP